MEFTIRGTQYEVGRDDVLNVTRTLPPSALDGRHMYFVTLHERQYPIKQVVQQVTGLASPVFTSQDAHRILSRLGFDISERSAAATMDTGTADTSTDPLRLLVVFETDEDGWEVASCPTLPGCHSQGRTRDEALANIREAIRGYLASMREHGDSLPASSTFQVLEVPV